MRRTRWAFAFVLTVSLLAPQASQAKGRPHGHGHGAQGHHQPAHHGKAHHATVHHGKAHSRRARVTRGAADHGPAATHARPAQRPRHVTKRHRQATQHPRHVTRKVERRTSRALALQRTRDSVRVRRILAARELRSRREARSRLPREPRRIRRQVVRAPAVQPELRPLAPIRTVLPAPPLPRLGPGLRVRHDRLGRRLAVAPRPLVTRIDRVFVTAPVPRPARVRRVPRARLIPLPTPGRTVVDFGLSVPDRLGLFPLPLAVTLTDSLVDDVDLVVRRERFAAFDRNLDGRVRLAEWPAGRSSFRRYDLDGDRVLVGDELFADHDFVLVDRDRFLLFQGLDRDDDGLVAPWEWPGDLDSFFYRDFNGDGAIALDEFVGLGTPSRSVRSLQFDALDFDSNGTISRVEWIGDPVRFSRLDRNDNGVVGRWEFGVGWLIGV